jgi:hypothetical protein
MSTAALDLTEDVRVAMYAAASARYETATATAIAAHAAAAAARARAAAHQAVADEMAPWVEVAAQLFLAADRLDGSLRSAGVVDPETFGDVADIQEKALALAQLMIAAHGRCLQRVEYWLAVAAAAEAAAAAAEAEAAAAEAEMAAYS